MQLAETLHTALDLISEGVVDRKLPFHTPSVASISDDGFPNIRTVVLRNFDKQDRLIRFHTDRRANKCDEMLSNPRLAIHFYDADKKIQLKLKTTASMHCGDDIAADAWRSSQPSSKLCYCAPVGPGSDVVKPPSAPLMKNTQIEKGFTNFCVVNAHISQLEWLYLSADGHQRAIFVWRRNGSLESRWLAP